eukprot:TRINITY_DN14124_c1_g1_i2.p1 TRINITY_DN14124_c1_g1~~TRINITY_DN14124_c1_g1_i2.p1  ORF type:complete len:809 (-),score=244.78 TRINITY_DN14124_c1_g1_i2:95-2521(-)
MEPNGHSSAGAGGDVYEAFFAAESLEDTYAVAATAAGGPVTTAKPRLASTSLAAGSGYPNSGALGARADARGYGGRSSSNASAGDVAGGIESEYAMLTSTRTPGEDGAADLDVSVCSSSNAAVFALDDGDSDEECMETEEAHSSDLIHLDCRAPELPEAPRHFGAEDLVLRDALVEFYLRHKPDNLANIDAIVQQYRGRGVVVLWSQLAAKYGVSNANVVELLAKTLYVDSFFEFRDDAEAAAVQQELAALGAGAAEGPALRASHLRRLLAADTLATGGEDPERQERAVRALCFRGLGGCCEEARPMAWKVLLRSLPLRQRAEWAAVEEQRRTTYEAYKNAFFVVTSTHKLQIKAQGKQLQEALEVLQQIQKDVDRTRQDCDLFRKPATNCMLVVMLFIYARLNPDVGYVQGMSEILAVVFYVLSREANFVEADIYGCFSELMAEIKPSFTRALELAGDGVTEVVGAFGRLLAEYDPELANHLQQHGSPQNMFAFRWSTILFAQDLSLPDVALVWDSLIADASRSEFLVHACVALMLAIRDELLRLDDQSDLAEAMRGAARRVGAEGIMRRAWALCAIERRQRASGLAAKSALQIVGGISQWAKGAAARAQEVGSGVSNVSRTLQEHMTPLVKDQAGKAGGVAADVAKESANKLQGWLEESAPARKQGVEKLQSGLSNLLHKTRNSTMAAAGAAASGASVAAAKTQELWADGASGTAAAASTGSAAAAGGAASEGDNAAGTSTFTAAGNAGAAGASGNRFAGLAAVTAAAARPRLAFAAEAASVAAAKLAAALAEEPKAEPTSVANGR